ncbi:MAG TPA: GntR family transcriptional regulator [Roseomonas sp.]|jgi:DNA-binding GntR family transcriptional regulator
MSFSTPTRPRYAALAQDMAEQIARGHYPVGSQLPTELELSAERGVSRATVRAALERLEELGLVSRRRRAGTRVTATQAAPAAGGYVQSLSAVDDLLQYAAETERRILRVAPVVADDALAARLGLRPGSRWHRVSSLRVPVTAGGEPLCWTDTYADAAAAPADLPRRLRLGEAGQRLIATVLAEWSGRPIAEVSQRIHAAGIPAGAVAEALRAEADMHALRITRRYLDAAGAPLAVSESWHPADRFTYAMRLKRSPSAR